MSGPLQLAPGTVLVCAESALKEGKLNEAGVRNLESLKHVLEWQKLEYDFQFYKMPMEVDIPAIVTSSGRKSLLASDTQLPLSNVATIEKMCTVAEQLSGLAEIEAVREYLEKCRAMVCPSNRQLHYS